MAVGSGETKVGLDEFSLLKCTSSPACGWFQINWALPSSLGRHETLLLKLFFNGYPASFTRKKMWTYPRNYQCRLHPNLFVKEDFIMDCWQWTVFSSCTHISKHVYLIVDLWFTVTALWQYCFPNTLFYSVLYSSGWSLLMCINVPSCFYLCNILMGDCRTHFSLHIGVYIFCMYVCHTCVGATEVRRNCWFFLRWS